jgi:large repetitive protein
MRKILSLFAVLALAACGGGGGGGTASNPPAPPTAAPTAAPGGLVTPQFTIVVPSKTGSSSQRLPNGLRKPNFVSSGALSVTITLVSVGGGAPNVTPTSVTSSISSSTCPCVVNGPPSPPGQLDVYSIVTFDAAGGTGNQLDTASVSFTPTAGQNNVNNVTLMGIPSSIGFAAPSTETVGTAGQAQALLVNVRDHAGQTITGTYANVVRITDPDPATYGASIPGTVLSGTHTGSGCTTSCVDLQTSTDTATLTYSGLAEDPTTLTSSVLTGSVLTAGTATFTPTLSAITHTTGVNSAAAGTPVGIDLFTNASASPSGYSGTEGYHENGYTDSPYNKVLTTIDGTACTAFAGLGAANVTNDTVFTATAIASPTAGLCTRVVSDGLAAAGHGTGGPQFVVTYTTSQVSGSSKIRHQR